VSPAEAAAGGPGEQIDPAAIQQMIVRAIKLYASRTEQGEGFPPFGEEHGVTATEVALFCSALMRAAEIAPFELAMWETWSV